MSHETELTDCQTGDKLPDMYHLQLTDHQWKQLEKAAQLHKKKNIRRFINSELYRLEKTMKQDVNGVDCIKNPKKRYNAYPIPSELRPFYAKLACIFGTTASAIIFRMLIFPHITDISKPETDSNPEVAAEHQ
jgi:hypothetical protein